MIRRSAALCVTTIFLLAAGVAAGAGSMAVAQQPVASDGRILLPEQTDAPRPAKPRKVRQAQPADDGLAGLKEFSKEWWEKKKAIDDAEGARLGKRMSICRGC